MAEFVEEVEDKKEEPQQVEEKREEQKSVPEPHDEAVDVRLVYTVIHLSFHCVIHD